MNFLAHLYLSGTDHQVIVGNFIGDFVKGKVQVLDYPQGIRNGITLHRAIDEYTDSHAVVKTSKKRLWDRYRHYAAVIIDVYYDHFLAANWHDYHAEPLTEYAQQMYTILQNHYDVMPEEVKHLLPYMVRGDWLSGYASQAGISQALVGMSRRTRFTSHLEHAGEELAAHYTELEKEFRSFFSDLISFTSLTRNNLLRG